MSKVAWIVLAGIRLLFMFIAIVLFFTLEGREISFGFWIIIEMIFYIVNELFTYRRILIETISKAIPIIVTKLASTKK